MSWGLRNRVLLSFLGSIFCKWPVINVTLHKLNIEVHKIQDIGYFSTVLMKLFELDMFELGIKHQLPTFVGCILARQSYLRYIFKEIADNAP